MSENSVSQTAPSPSEGLFNVADSYLQALRRSRVSRGEPAEGAERVVWEAKEWMSEHRPSLSIAAFIAGCAVTALIGGSLVWWNREKVKAVGSARPPAEDKPASGAPEQAA